MFLLVDSGDNDSEEEEGGEGMFKTNIYLTQHNIIPHSNIGQSFLK